MDVSTRSPVPVTLPTDQDHYVRARAAILLADSQADSRAALRSVLQARDRDVVMAETVQDVLQQVLRREFAAIILDAGLFGIDAFALASRIRSVPRSARTPIIFLAEKRFEEFDIHRGTAVGAFDYVVKPPNLLILKAKIDILVELFNKDAALRRAENERRLLIEEKSAAEQLLRAHEEHQALLLESLPIALYTSSCGGGMRRLRFVNESVERLTGFSRRDFLRQSNLWEARLNCEDHGRVVRELGEIEQTRSITTEYRWRHADGTERYLFDHAVLMSTADGETPQILGMWLDVTDRKQLETRLLHASKLEAVGSLTGGIVHDFRNMLHVVIGNLDLLRLELRDNGGASRRLRSALDGAQTCADLTSRLVAFSRRSTMKTSQVNLSDVAAAVAELLTRTLGAGVNIEVSHSEECWPVCVDRPQLEAVVVNLAINAREAMPDGGTLGFKVENVASSDACGKNVASTPGTRAFVRLTVSDTGVGMSPEIRNRIFEPCFTTKPAGKGSGMGLSMVANFVKQANGVIAVESSPGNGTRFHIELPRAADEIPTAEDRKS